MYNKIKQTIQELLPQPISEDRKAVLQPLIEYVQHKVSKDLPVNINFICTHNSRRSHLTQIWGQAISSYFKVPQVNCYSGGTEATALFPKVADTLAETGFQILKLADSDNPVYAIKYADNEMPIIGFSKKYDDLFNPLSDFVAIMTCSQADGGCPFIAGAEKRVAITYNDPKEFDNTPKEIEAYRERSLQIAHEMIYVFSNIGINNES
jgi:arsenate reductase